MTFGDAVSLFEAGLGVVEKVIPYLPPALRSKVEPTFAELKGHLTDKDADEVDIYIDELQKEKLAP